MAQVQGLKDTDEEMLAIEDEYDELDGKFHDGMERLGGALREMKNNNPTVALVNNATAEVGGLVTINQEILRLSGPWDADDMENAGRIEQLQEALGESESTADIAAAQKLADAVPKMEEVSQVYDKNYEEAAVMLKQLKDALLALETAMRSAGSA